MIPEAGSEMNESLLGGDDSFAATDQDYEFDIDSTR